jgi:hypothetical protein
VLKEQRKIKQKVFVCVRLFFSEEEQFTIYTRQEGGGGPLNRRRSFITKGSDEAKNEPLLRGLLSPDSNLFDQILP